MVEEVVGELDVVMVGRDSFLVAPAHIFMPHPPEEPEEEADDSQLHSGSEPMRVGSATPLDLNSKLSSSKDSKGMLNGIVQTAPSITLEENFERPNSTPPSPTSDNFRIFSLEHDYALIAIPGGESFYQELSYVSPPNVESIVPGQVSVSVTTLSRGLMHGWLDGRPTLMRLPCSSNFSKFYPVNFIDPVSEGDWLACG